MSIVRCVQKIIILVIAKAAFTCSSMEVAIKRTKEDCLTANYVLRC